MINHEKEAKKNAQLKIVLTKNVAIFFRDSNYVPCTFMTLDEVLHARFVLEKAKSEWDDAAENQIEWRKWKKNCWELKSEQILNVFFEIENFFHPTWIPQSSLLAVFYEKKIVEIISHWSELDFLLERFKTEHKLSPQSVK
jgi:hypothetical protein